MPPMMTLVDIMEQLEKIDHQMVRLLEERRQLCMQGGGVDPEQEADLLAFFVEELSERGMDDDRAEKIGKLIAGLCRGARD